MKKIIAISILILGFSCTPYQRIFLNSANRSTFLEDSCDIFVIKQLKLLLDAAGYYKVDEQTLLLEDLLNASECEYYVNRFYPASDQDSTIWLLSIRPISTGKDELIIGNLYTFDPDQDSAFIFQRRVKEYSQTEDFESGKYVVFTYLIENDTTIIVKAGTSRF